jgi:Leucine-rich repeat (LRR) protein
VACSNNLTDLPDEIEEFRYLRILRLKYNHLKKLPAVVRGHGQGCVLIILQPRHGIRAGRGAGSWQQRCVLTPQQPQPRSQDYNGKLAEGLGTNSHA